MKKIFAIALFSALAVSCSKKETATESNVMLEEPKVEMTDSVGGSSARREVDPTAAGSGATIRTDSAATPVVPPSSSKEIPPAAESLNSGTATQNPK